MAILPYFKHADFRVRLATIYIAKTMLIEDFRNTSGNSPSTTCGIIFDPCSVLCHMSMSIELFIVISSPRMLDNAPSGIRSIQYINPITGISYMIVTSERAS